MINYVSFKNYYRWFKYQVAGQHSWLWYRTFGLNPNKKHLQFDSGTNLVVEAPPRSANSYAVCALKEIQPKQRLNIAHHTHVLALNVRAVQASLPVATIVRDPLEVVTSIKIRTPDTNPGERLHYYRRFFKSILDLKNEVLIARFETIIGNFNRFLREMNESFGTNFKAVDDMEKLNENVFSRINQINEKLSGGDRKRVSLPDKEKEQLKEDVSRKIRRKYSERLFQARSIYDEILDFAI